MLPEQKPKQAAPSAPLNTHLYPLVLPSPIVDDIIPFSAKVDGVPPTHDSA